MTNTELIRYCEKREDKPDKPYNHFFKSEMQVRMIGVGKTRIVTVQLEETEDTAENLYWAFKDLEKDEINFIYPTLQQVKMCSGTYFEREIEEGTGKFVRIKVVEINS